MRDRQDIQGSTSTTEGGASRAPGKTTRTQALGAARAPAAPPAETPGDASTEAPALHLGFWGPITGKGDEAGEATPAGPEPAEPAATSPGARPAASTAAAGAEPGAGATPGAETAPGAGPGPATAGAAGAEGQSGAIGLVAQPGVTKSAGDADDDERADMAASKTDGVPVDLSFSTTFSSTPTRSVGDDGKLDPGELSAGFTFSQPGGRAVSPFGGEYYEPAFSGTTWTFTGGVCKIATTLDINCPWGTASGGKDDIASGSDGKITKANYEEVRDDLKPGASSPHKSRRRKFYSQTLVERHEKFHGTDDEGWTKSSGIALAQTKAKASTVSAGTAGADVTKVLNDCLTLLKSENLKWYKGGGASHDAYAGEIRAYGDGKPEYQKLSDAVDTHGKTL